jgi:hypothetical protein
MSEQDERISKVRASLLLDRPVNDPIPENEMPCRRAFEDEMRNRYMPGKLGVPDPLDYQLLYAGWVACWRHFGMGKQ